MSSWCNIESDPGIFTSLVESFGVKDVQFEEVVSLDKETLAKLGTCYGIIFLFRWRKSDYESDTRPAVEFSSDSSLYFAKQKIQNACATQAIINILLNSADKIQIGPLLSQLKAFTGDFDPSMRGEVIGQEQDIRKAHNSFARAEPFVMEGSKAAKDDDDVFHFIGYTPINGKVYELDGLKPGPIGVGPCGDDWLSVLRPELERRISKFTEGEIHFNLMAIIKDRRVAAKVELADLETKVKEIEEKSGDGPCSEAEEGKAVARSRIFALQALLGEEAAKRENWAKENMRRKHNYIPFVMALLRKLAKAKKLDSMKVGGKKFMEERSELAKKRETEKKEKEEKKKMASKTSE